MGLRAVSQKKKKKKKKKKENKDLQKELFSTLDLLDVPGIQIGDKHLICLES